MKKWRPQSVHRKGRSSQWRAVSREFRSPTRLKPTDRQRGHRANSTLQHLHQAGALGYVGRVVHARRCDPHDNQGEIILRLPLIEKPVNLPKHFISEFPLPVCPVLFQDREEASFVELHFLASFVDMDCLAPRTLPCSVAMALSASGTGISMKANPRDRPVSLSSINLTL
jgi:hypothetical protein